MVKTEEQKSDTLFLWVYNSADFFCSFINDPGKISFLFKKKKKILGLEFIPHLTKKIQ